MRTKGERSGMLAGAALCALSPDLTRWMEPAGAVRIDDCPGRTFLLPGRQEEAQLTQWLAWMGAPPLFENDGDCVYGFESAQALTSGMLLLKNEGQSELRRMGEALR